MATNSDNNANGDREQDKREVTINIRTAQNGISVDARADGCYDSDTYVYKTLEEATADLPSVMSLAREKAAKKEAERKANKDKKGNTPMIEEDY